MTTSGQESTAAGTPADAPRASGRPPPGKGAPRLRGFRLALLVGGFGIATLLAVAAYTVVAYDLGGARGGVVASAADPAFEALVVLRAEKNELERKLREVEASVSPCPRGGAGGVLELRTDRRVTPAAASGIAHWADEQEYQVPGMSVSTNVRLAKAKARLERSGECTPDKDTVKGVSFLTHDTCQLGHALKDAAHLFVYLSSGGRLDNILYTGECMAPEGAGSGTQPRHARTWQAAAKYWFTAVLRGYGRPVNAVHHQAAGKRELCVETVVERDERWRWFPGQRTAWAFRQALQLEFGLRVPVKLYGQGKLRVSILKRSDRTFDENRAAAFLRGKFGGVADFSVTSLSDNKESTYLERLQLLADTDMLIAAHGAALANVAVMRRGTSVVELFPHNFRRHAFEDLARLMGLNYFAFEAARPPPNCTGCTARLGAASLDDPLAYHGQKSCAKCDIRIAEVDWYYLFKNAATMVWLGMSRHNGIHQFDVRKHR
ncbi:hypothetical protein DIPPA_30204 [Diplonema papillatum]|nr:hypothetical protein DIPPA_30204 [Diplonema papillatum]